MLILVAFLKGILKYLNILNTELQGSGKFRSNLIQNLTVWRQTIDIFEEMIEKQEFSYFSK